jgi:hypothetical protein
MNYSIIFGLLQALASPTPTPIPIVPSWKDPITISTIVIAFSTVASVCVSLLLWSVTRRYTKVTRDIFEAAHRPYIALSDFSGDGGQFGNNEPVRVTFGAKYRNSGSVPGNKITVTWNLRTKAGAQVKFYPPDEKETVLLSGDEESTGIWTDLDNELTKAWLDSSLELEVSLVLTYQGVTGTEYSHRKTGTYSRHRRLVLNSDRFI